MKVYYHIICAFVFACAMTGCADKKPSVLSHYAALHPGHLPHAVESETRLLTFNSQESLAYLGGAWALDNRAPILSKDKVWGIRENLDLSLVILKPSTRKLTLEMQPHSINGRAQLVKIFFNEQPLGECRFTEELGWDVQNFAFEIPSHIQKEGDNTLRFVSRFALSADDAGRGGDDRPLAFWLYSLRMEAPHYETPQTPDWESNALTINEKTFSLVSGSRLHFPMHLPDSELIELRLGNNSAPGTLYVFGEKSFPSREEITFTGGIADLSEHRGELVDFVFDANSEDVSWDTPEVWASAPLTIKAEEPPAAALPKVENVVLIVLDALRADALDSYGYNRNTSPNIGALAANSILYKRAYASVPFTYGSTWSLFTGAHPFQHGAVVDKFVPSKKLASLPSTLKNNGVYTACVAANAFLDNPAITIDFDEFHRAFETFNILAEEKKRDAGLVTRQALEILHAHKDKRFFLYLHYMQPHEPYYPAMPYLGVLNSLNDEAVDSHSAALRDFKYGAKKITPFQVAELRTRYDENLLDVDTQLALVLNALKENGLADKTAIVLTSDHGEAFWEHGALTHNNQVYDEMIRIPLIIHLPDNVRRVETSVKVKSTIDLYPAVCELLGAPVPEHINAIGKQDAPKTFMQPLSYSGIYGTDSPKEAFIFERHKLIKNDSSHELEIYDLLLDGHEKNNLALTRPLLALKLLAEAEWWKEKQTRFIAEMGWEPEPFIKPEQDHSKELEALGYF